MEWNGHRFATVCVGKQLACGKCLMREIVAKMGGYLDARHCKAERLDGCVCQPVCLGELNAGHIAVVLGEKTETLMQRGAAMMRQRAYIRLLIGYLIAIDGGIALAGDKQCGAILIIIWN